MATLQDLIDRTRLELGNLKEPFYTRFRASGDGTRYDLKGVTNIDTHVLYLLGDPTPITSGVTVQNRAGLVIFDTPPAAGTEYVVEGESSKYFSDEELQVFVESAFQMHTRGRNPKISYGSLPPTEVLLVAILAQIEALWVLKTSSAYDINVHAPEGMFIPRAQRFQQLNTLLQEVEARYRELSAALGTGLYAVEMFNLRRVSRTTGRYVPIYIDREFDDTRIPQRVFPDVGNQFGESAEPTTEQHTLQLYQGRRFEKELDILEEDLSLTLTADDEFEVSTFRSKFSTHRLQEVIPQFELEKNATSVTLRMSSEDTTKLESTGSYVWTIVWRRSGEEVARLEGRLLVEAGYPLKSPHIKIT